MLLLILAFIVFIIFLFFTNRNTKAGKALIFVLIMYFLAMSSRILYLSKDIYYYNLIKKFIYLPTSLWQWLCLLNIDRFWVIRFLNWSSLGIIWCSIYFALTILNDNIMSTKLRKSIQIIASVYIILCLILFDPRFNILMYYFLYPKYMTTTDFHILTEIITSITRYINVSLLAVSILIHVQTWRHSPKIKYIKYHYFLMVLSFILLGSFYVMFISDTPAYFLNISKFANSYTYVSLDINRTLRYYTLFPYILIIILLFITYSIYRIVSINQELARADFEYNKQIDSSDTTSKVFCHYIKNELLAIQSELKTLSESNHTEVSDAIKPIINHCDYIYSRIDTIHRSTKTSQLHLVQCNLVRIMEHTLEQFSSELKHYTVRKEYISDYVPVLGDPVYLEQAIHNVIHNALDAMENLPSDRKTLVLRIQKIEQWIIMEVEDSGVGISSNNLQNVFTPFYSTYPTSKHWGIGLSLVYKLISAHEGRIDIDSVEQKGTTVKIMLPDINVG